LDIRILTKTDTRGCIGEDDGVFQRPTGRFEFKVKRYWSYVWPTPFLLVRDFLQA